MKNSRANILVVEDDPAILGGLMDVLVFNGYAATGNENGINGLETALNESFDLVILDVMLPGKDGLSICKELRKEKPSQAIVMLTAKGSEDDIVAGFSAGADDYIPKPFSLRELMVRVEAVLRRAGKNLGNARVSINGIDLDENLLMAQANEKKVEITRREMDILLYLHKNKDRIVSKQDLLLDVWHYKDPGIETRTVEIHIQKLRKKLTLIAPGKAPFIHTVRGQGYRLG